ncbi:MAG: DUF1684 domain-containing protein [Flavobacteriales bacterium]|nr:DUF1684 domain-containing protein [Flavobacteriales bacterium]
MSKRKTLKWKITILTALLFSCGVELIEHKNDVRNHRRKKFEAFTNRETSPIPVEHKTTFSGLKYFEIDFDYKVSAQLLSLPDQQDFPIIRTGGDTVIYKHVGYLEFELSNQAYKLSCFSINDDSNSSLFVPFNDLTNGAETYDAGRYLDIAMHDGRLDIDFNKAYNPYCAYNDEYTCPIPPRENFLNIKILAGEKKYH